MTHYATVPLMYRKVDLPAAVQLLEREAVQGAERVTANLETGAPAVVVDLTRLVMREGIVVVVTLLVWGSVGCELDSWEGFAAVEAELVTN